VVTAAAELPPCPACGASHLAGDQFCEACGAALPGGPAGAPAKAAVGTVSAPAGALATICPGCGGTAFSDGYCTVCGMRQPAARDHEERQGPGWAGVSDKGLRHHRNEDAFGVAPVGPDRLALVVSDGVSTTHRPDEASTAAVSAALEVLAGASGTDPTGAAPEPAGPAGGADLSGAAAAAQSAVRAMASDGTPGPADPDLGPPSCTFLAAVVGDAIDFASLGDCRAYWLDAGGEARMLTSDDSWAGEQVAAGTLTTEQAMADERAHVITRWLGPDADPAWEPRLTHFDPPGPGRLLACSDGLWNYLSEPADVAAAVGTRTDLLDIARTLTARANQAGGADNITVVVVDWPWLPAGHPGPDGKDTP
jgi:serine/threonine protein phosphatase PrpC